MLRFPVQMPWWVYSQVMGTWMALVLCIGGLAKAETRTNTETEGEERNEVLLCRVKCIGPASSKHVVRL